MLSLKLLFLLYIPKICVFALEFFLLEIQRVLS